MRYSIKPRDICERFGFLSFAKNMSTHATKVAKNLSNKYGQKLLDSAKKPIIDAIKTASKKAIQKRAEATGDLIGNKITDKITSVSTKLRSKKSTKKLQNNETEVDLERANPKKRYICKKERQRVIDELRLV